MQLTGSKYLYSPTDLTLFMRSPFASWMNRFALAFPKKAPERDPDDELMAVLQNKGFQHEEAQEELFSKLYCDEPFLFGNYLPLRALGCQW